MHLNTIAFVTALIWSSSLCENLSAHRANHRRITDFIYNNYYRKDPPFLANSLEIPLSIDYSPIAILDINEVRHIFAYTAYFQVNWVDAQLSWNASDYGNLTSVVIDLKSIWNPRLFIANSVDGFEFFDSTVHAVVCSDGNVFVHVAGVFKTTCSVDVTRYPFDIQICSLVLYSTPWDHFTFKTHVIKIPLHKQFSPESEWILLNISAEVVELKNTIHPTAVGTYVKFIFLMERKSMFYIVTTIFPMFLMSVLTSFVFLVPEAMGDKMCYLVSIFLSYAVFLNFITQNMPISSEGDSLFEVYYIFVLVHCSLAMLSTVVIINIDYYRTKHTCNIPDMDATMLENLQPKNNDEYQGVIQDNRPRQTTMAITLFALFLAMTFACPIVLVLYT